MRQKCDFQLLPGQVYFDQAEGEPSLKQMCQQEESYSSTVGILYRSVVREDRMWRNARMWK